MTFQQVQKYEKGSNRIPIDRLIALSEYLDISLPSFFDFMELPTDDDELNGLRQTLTGREFRLLLHGWHAVKVKGGLPLYNSATRLAGVPRAK